MPDHDNDGRDDKNIIDLAHARKRQRTLRPAGKQRGGRGQGGKQSQPSGAGTAKRGRIWAYLQFLIFLAVLAYFLQLCHRGG